MDHRKIACRFVLLLLWPVVHIWGDEYDAIIWKRKWKAGAI